MRDHRLFTEPLTRCERPRGLLWRCAAWVWDQLVWMLGMALLACGLWVFAWAVERVLGGPWGMLKPWDVVRDWWEALRAAGWLGEAALPRGGPLPLAVVALPEGGGLILLMILGTSGLLAWALNWGQRGEREMARKMEQWVEDLRAQQPAPLPPSIEAMEAELRWSVIGDDEPGMSAIADDDTRRILSACSRQAREVSGLLAAAAATLCDDEREDALRAAQDGQAKLMQGLAGLLSRLGIPQSQVVLEWDDSSFRAALLKTKDRLREFHDQLLAARGEDVIAMARARASAAAALTPRKQEAQP